MVCLTATATPKVTEDVRKAFDIPKDLFAREEQMITPGHGKEECRRTRAITQRTRQRSSVVLSAQTAGKSHPCVFTPEH